MHGMQRKRLEDELQRLVGRFRGIKVADADAKTGTFSGYGAYFGNEDHYGDVIERGAFAQTLEEWRAEDKLPPMLLQHGGGGFFGGAADDLVPVGKWDSMREDSKGLRVEGHLLAMGTDRGQQILEALKEGVLDGLSIGFRLREFKRGTKPGEPDRILTNIDLVEVSIVTFPANPKARVTSVKTLTGDDMRELESVLAEQGFSRADRRSAVLAFKHWLQRGAGAPGPTPAEQDVPELSDGQRMLGGLMLDEVRKLLRVIR